MDILYYIVSLRPAWTMLVPLLPRQREEEKSRKCFWFSEEITQKKMSLIVDKDIDQQAKDSHLPKCQFPNMVTVSTASFQQNIPKANTVVFLHFPSFKFWKSSHCTWEKNNSLFSSSCLFINKGTLQSCHFVPNVILGT